ncbi:cytochrome P450 [Leptodontidium sp. MPI-SDFR-AT-0119]|nr:cytochrome P450 [Leptodontidium sp. MPI-SDFR-AT-0119]
MLQFNSHPLAIWATGLGLLSHWSYFIHGEHHMKAPVYGCLFVALLPFLYILELHVHKNASLAVQDEVELVAAFIASLFSRFSGPFGAKISKIWHVWKVRYSQNHLVLHELYQEYETFVRTGPEEITIFDPEAVVAMNGPGSNCTRADWYDGIAPLKSVANLRSPTVHDQRRRIWDKAFSANAVQDYDSRITKYAEQLNQIIVASLGRPVNLYDLFSFYTSDVMSDLSFGKSFGNLLGGKFHDSVVGVRDFMSVFGTLSPVPCDSMATTLINLFANLSRYPKYQEHILKVEIQTLPSILDFPAVLKLPVLKSVIMETLRLWPPVPTRSGRLWRAALSVQPNSFQSAGPPAQRWSSTNEDTLHSPRVDTLVLAKG